MSKFVLILIALLPFNARCEQVQKAFHDDAQKLIQVTGALEIGQKLSDYFVGVLTSQVKKLRPDVPPEVPELIRTEVTAMVAESLPALVEQFIEIYAKYFTDEELKQLLAFYETPLGQKAIKVMPQMLQEDMLLGRRWGEALAPTLIKRITEKLKPHGIDLSA